MKIALLLASALASCAPLTPSRPSAAAAQGATLPPASTAPLPALPPASPPAAAPGALPALLAKAHAGAIIALPAGAYANNRLAGLSFNPPVTIESADPAHPAVLTDLLVAQSSGLTFKGLVFSTDGSLGANPFTVGRSQAVTFELNRFIGARALLAADNPRATGLLLRNSTDVSVTGNDFTLLTAGVGLDNGSGVTISGNTFHELHLRGVAGGGTSNLTIADNSFSGFFPKARGLHPDVIFIWTSRTEKGGTGVTITHNTMTRGDGPPVQGIMVSGAINGPIAGVVVTGNTVTGEEPNGIRLIGITGLTVSGNVVTGYCDMHPSKIFINHVSGTQVLAGNVAERYAIGGVFSRAAPGRNSLNACVAPSAAH